MKNKRILTWCAASLAILVLLGLVLCLVVDVAGGHFSHDPEDAEWLLSEPAQALIEEAYRDIEPGTLRDYHVHLIGMGADREKAFIHPDSFSWLHPVRRLRNMLYLDASDISNRENADAEYLARLVRLIRAMPGFGRHYLLAFDKYYLPDGSVDESRTQFYVSNEYMAEIADRYPDLFIPVVSIHPYRKDAIEALDKWAEKGVRMIKWLPNAQGMDPADPGLLPFYEAMKKHDMALLSHTGQEQAIDADGQQELGNPLRLRQALDAGVKVIAAHAASLGKHEDLDHPDRPMVPAYTLFLRMMDEKRYKGLLFGEISAITLVNRVADPLEALLQRPDLHHRLVNGSDYPVPAINALIHLDELVDAGMLAEELVDPLREIYGVNPLLFDLVLKRSLKLPATELGFEKAVFTANKRLPE